MVVRDGAPLDARPPPYEELDYLPAAIRSGEVPVLSVDYAPEDGHALVHTTIGRALAATELNGGSCGDGGQNGSAAAAAVGADGE